MNAVETKTLQRRSTEKDLDYAGTEKKREDRMFIHI